MKNSLSEVETTEESLHNRLEQEKEGHLSLRTGLVKYPNHKRRKLRNEDGV